MCGPAHGLHVCVQCGRCGRWWWCRHPAGHGAPAGSGACLCAALLARLSSRRRPPVVAPSTSVRVAHQVNQRPMRRVVHGTSLVMACHSIKAFD